MRTCIVLAVLLVGVGGCSSPPTSRPTANPVLGHPPQTGSSAAPSARPAEPTPQATTPPPPPAPTAPSRPAPSLEQERAAQAERAAATLSKRTGVPVEKVESASPLWWPTGSAGGDGYGRGRASTLESAYQQASKQAAGADRNASVQKAAYTRTPMGEYTVWVAMGAQTAAAPPTPPPPGAPKPAPPSPAAPGAAAPSAPAAASDIPSWFNTKAKEENGRVIVGAMADAPTVREAPRMASEAGKAALAEVMGVEPSEVRLESTYVRKQGEGYRAYVLVSCAGTIKK